jgi:hypothetical protein
VLRAAVVAAGLTEEKQWPRGLYPGGLSGYYEHGGDYGDEKMMTTFLSQYELKLDGENLTEGTPLYNTIEGHLFSLNALYS